MLTSPWVLMPVALVLHLVGYLGALMTHSFDIPEVKVEIPEEEPPGIEEILESRSQAYNWYFKTEEIDKFVAELRERETEIEERESNLKALEAHLEIEKEELELLKNEIEKRSKTLSEEITIVRKNEYSNLRNLATSYSNLTPEATVAIFEQMDETLVIKILALMKPDIVAGIFEELARVGSKEPAKVRMAAKLSEELRLHYKEKVE